MDTLYFLIFRLYLLQIFNIYIISSYYTFYRASTVPTSIAPPIGFVHWLLWATLCFLHSLHVQLSLASTRSLRHSLSPLKVLPDGRSLRGLCSLPYHDLPYPHPQWAAFSATACADAADAAASSSSFALAMHNSRPGSAVGADGDGAARFHIESRIFHFCEKCGNSERESNSVILTTSCGTHRRVPSPCLAPLNLRNRLNFRLFQNLTNLT